MSTADSVPVLVVLPAMGVAGRYYSRFTEALALRAQVHALACDLLSGGGRRRGARDFGYREIVEHEIPAIVTGIRKRFPGRPVILCGHSLGGQLALLASSRMPEPPDGLVLIAAGTAHHRAWPPGTRLKARLIVRLIRLAAGLLPWYPGDMLGFGGDQPRRLMRDWGYNATTGRYRLEGSSVDEAQLAKAVSSLQLPVLAVGVHGDLVAPEGAQIELIAPLQSACVQRVVLEGADYGGRWRRHFGWARNPEAAADVISHWVKRLWPGGPAFEGNLGDPRESRVASRAGQATSASS